MTKQVLGTDLPLAMQQEALRKFANRYTGDHKPTWALGEWKDGKPYPLHFASDKEWLANTRFHVTASGHLSRRHRYCESCPTWPNNPELRRGAGESVLPC